MTKTPNKDNCRSGGRATTKFDALVVGAGIAGLYQLYRLRELGLNVRAIDAASGVGGTWYWNRYPGARVDSEGYQYQYLFSEDLYKRWSWSERFPSQPEIERWLNYVADQLDLRKDIQFGTTVQSAHFNEATERWVVVTDKGNVIDTQFVVTCCGVLSAPHARRLRRRDRGRTGVDEPARLDMPTACHRCRCLQPRRHPGVRCDLRRRAAS